jgi:hypothetical protein
VVVATKIRGQISSCTVDLLEKGSPLVDALVDTEE